MKRTTAVLGLIPTVFAFSADASEKNHYSPDDRTVIVVDTPSSDADLLFGASYVYDSNTTQTTSGSGASVAVFDYGIEYGSGNQSARGGYYGLSYLGQAFVYENSSAAAGRDTLEHQLGAYLGLNGGRTQFRLTGDVFFNNGNGIEYTQFDRESRRAASVDYTVGGNVIRDLPHGSLEFGAGFRLRDFEGGTDLNDGTSYYGDAAWFFEPGFAPKTSIGIGLNAGEDDFDSNVSQSYITPSFRWRYELSGKTSLNASTGYEFRSIDGDEDSDSFVFDAGVSWAATESTSLKLGGYRNVRPSYVSIQENYTATGVALTLSQQLPSNFTLSSTLGYENADYDSTDAAFVALREDDYFKAGVNLSRGIALFDHLDGSISVFYNFNQNDSTIDNVEFDQHVTGIRLGLTY